MTSTKKLFEPGDPQELLRGWLLHAHKGRDRHDAAARLYQTYRYRLGIPTIILSTVAGASVFATLSTSLGILGSITFGLVGMASATLAALQTFFDFAGQAERHRMAAVKYKTVIRKLEQALMDILGGNNPQNTWLNNLRARLDALEEMVPVVEDRIYNRVEEKYTNVSFVAKALELPPGGLNA